MFIWDFSGIITLSITICLALVMGMWLFYTAYDQAEEGAEEWDLLTQCPYCAYVFLDYLKKNGLSCPRCKSFLEGFKREGSSNA